MKDKLTKRKILIFGGTGFIGTNLVVGLLNQGYKDITVVTEIENDERIDDFLFKEKEKIRIEVADVRYYKEIENLVKDKNVIYCLAGKSGAADSLEKPFLNLEINVKGNLNILEACRKLNRKAKLIFISSRMVYGRPLYLPVDERHPVNPIDIYGINKLAAENYFTLYYDLYGIKSTILRVTNPYGPRQIMGQNKYGIINWFIYLAIKDKDLPIFGKGGQLRDYIYIDDLSNLMIKITESDKSNGKFYNVGGGKYISLFEMAEKIVKIARSGRIKHINWEKEYKRVETGDFYISIENVKRELNWSPNFDIDKGLEKTINYIKGIRL